MYNRCFMERELEKIINNNLIFINLCLMRSSGNWVICFIVFLLYVIRVD